MTDPDLTTEVIGYRQWYVTPELKLRAAHMRTQVWLPGDNTAQCQRTEKLDRYGRPKECKPCREAPTSKCECGFYALHSPSDFWYGKPATSLWASAVSPDTDLCISGVIVAWGALEVHHEGFRAQHARIVALAVPESRRDAIVVRAAATEYGVPCVPVNELPKIASEFGATVPLELRPEKPKPPESDFAQVMFSQIVQPSSWTMATSSTPLLWTPQSYHYAAGGPGSYFTFDPAVSTPSPPVPKKQSNRQGPQRKQRPPRNISPKKGR